MLKPLGDRVIIEVAKEQEKTIGGIVLTSSAQEKPQTGTVIAWRRPRARKWYES